MNGQSGREEQPGGEGLPAAAEASVEVQTVGDKVAGQDGGGGTGEQGGVEVGGGTRVSLENHPVIAMYRAVAEATEAVKAEAERKIKAKAAGAPEAVFGWPRLKPWGEAVEGAGLLDAIRSPTTRNGVQGVEGADGVGA